MNRETLRLFARMGIMVLGGIMVGRGKLDPTTFETIAGAVAVFLGGGDQALGATAPKA